MAGFNLQADPDVTEYRTVRTSGSQAYTIGDAVHQDRTSDATDVVPATAASTTVNIYAVAIQTIVSTATSLLVALVTPRQRWAADVTNNSVINHQMQRMILTDKATVNNTGTDDTTVNAVITQLGVIGALANKRVVVRFNTVANVTA